MNLAYKHWGPEPAHRSGLPSGHGQSRFQKIVFLHGMGGTGSLWRPISATLEHEFEILAPDQRGHGGSQIPHTPGSREAVGYTPLDYGRDVVELLKSKAFHPTWLVGHSMGVRTACATAHLYPDGIQGLVLIDLGFSGVAGGGLGEGLADFMRILPMTFESRVAARQFLLEHCPDPAIGQYLMAVSVPTQTGGVTFPFDQSALIQTIYAARDSAVRKWVRELGERSVPILVLRGETSTVWSHDEFETERQNFRDCPSIHFEEFQGTGHGLPFEKRSLFVERLRQFVYKSSP